MNTEDIERRRLMALHRYGLLDSPPEAIFDGIAIAVAKICEVPIALVTLVDVHRQWFKSAYGLKIRETPRDIAFCDQAITQPEKIMIVEDALADPRYQNNPLVTGDPNIRFYAGKPISSDDGYALGTLCVIDREPRELKPHQTKVLEVLGETVSAILQERYRLQKVAIDRDSTETLLEQNLERYQGLYNDVERLLQGVLELLPSAAAVIDPEGTVVSLNPAWRQFSASVGWPPLDVGGSYFDACKRGFAPLADKDRVASEGVRQVLSGETEQFTLEFPSSDGQCLMEVTPVAEPVSGAVIQHSFVAMS